MVAPHVLVDPAAGNTTLAHRMLARIVYFEDRPALFEHAVLWEAALFVWNGDYRCHPYQVYASVCRDHGIEPLREINMAPVMGFDGMLQDGSLDKDMQRLYALVGEKPVAVGAFRREIEKRDIWRRR